MRRKAVMLLFTLVFLTAVAGVAHSQCTTSFDVQASVCRETNLVLKNVTPSVSYAWDFCAGDFENTPVAQSVASSSLLFRARSFKIEHDDANNYVGFALSEPSGQLMRLNFGTSLLNTPTISNLGNFSGNVATAWGFTLHQENGNWYCFIPDFTDGSLIRLSFGTSLLSTPVVQNMGNFGGLLRFPSGMTIIQDGNNVFGFICNAGPGLNVAEILKLDFGTSITNTPIATTTHVPNANFLMDISFIKECDQWIGLATSFDNRRVFYLEYGSGLTNPPSIGELNLPGLPSEPCAINIEREGGEIYAFVQHANGLFTRISFGTSILDHTGTEQNLGNLGVSNSNFAFDLISEGSKWYGFSIDMSGSVTPGEGRLIRLDFPDNCSANQPTSWEENPQLVNYATAGTYEIALITQSMTGEVATVSKTVSVSALQAPDINFSSAGVCATHTTGFTAQSTGNVTSYVWEFGDLTAPGSGVNVNHTFSAANTYDVLLEITDVNTCKNYLQEPITIYNEPDAAFALPTGSPVCTNQEYVFENQTIFDPLSNPVWEWSVNGLPLSSQENLQHTFTTTTAQTISLKASIPGCNNISTQNISSLAVGPVVDFTRTGHCEDDGIEFDNTSSGPIDTYHWDFGDGQSSSITNPTYQYDTPGSYTVILTASNAAGCNNTATEQFTVYAKPQTDFAISPPPFSCSGRASRFNDLTPPPSDSNISSWLWNFDDPTSPLNTSSAKDPQHTYSLAGDYDVSLTVTTNFNCSATFQKTITIQQAPTASFTHTALCEDATVIFSDAATTNQAWNWQIGSSFYTVQNPQHIFTSPGNYDITLLVTGANNCIGTTTQSIVIRPKLAVDFSVSKNCVDQHTVFTNTTNDAADAITAVNWDFEAQGTATTNPATATFLNSGNVPVELTVQVQSGCEYSVIKAVTITDGPSAAFTASVNTGESPLVVQFENTSLDATTYRWSFNDANHSTSTQASPSFIYLNTGYYEAELVATDSKNCTDTTRQLIIVLEPSVLNPPFPNPSQSGKFTIEWKATAAGTAEVLLVDALGNEIQNQLVVSESGINSLVLNLSGRPSGLYILRIKSENKVKTYRLVVAQ